MESLITIRVTEKKGGKEERKKSEHTTRIIIFRPRNN